MLAPFGSSKKAASAAAAVSGRRLLRVNVQQADLSIQSLSLGRDIFVTGSLFRVHDDKEIDTEKGTSPTCSVGKVGSESPPLEINWEFNFGKTFNLNHETGLPSLKIFVFAKKKNVVSSTKTAIGMVEIDIDSVPPGGTNEWEDLIPVGAAANAEPGRIKVSVAWSRIAGEDAEAGGGGEQIFTLDGDLEDDSEEAARQFKEALGKKSKKLVLKKVKALEVMGNLLLGRFGTHDIEKRYKKWGGGKIMGEDDFLEFYRLIRPTAPNELQVVVVRAEKLRAADGTMLGGAGSSDPFVELSIGKLKKKTKVIKKELDPFWNQKFSFRVVDPQLALAVIVYDQDMTGTNFLGRTTVSMKSLVMATASGAVIEPEWHELKDSKGNKDTTTRGRVQLLLKWRHNTDMSFKPFTLKEEEDESSDEDEDDVLDDSKGADPEEAKKEGATKEKEEAADAAQEATDALKKDQENFKVISGDYQVHVHIIECRDLRPKDLNGMSDPYVSVEMFGKKQLTAVVNSTLNPVFDDLLIFNMKGLDKEEFEEALIKVTVKDSDLLTSNDMIGSYAFDATYVYFQKDHELYTAWVGLVNEKDLNDEGCQGYLKLSVQIVGPNDKLKIHHEVEGPADTDDQDIGSMVLMPPTIKKEQKWLVITAHCGEYLPSLDGSFAVAGVEVASAGIDAFYRAEFSDSKISSKVVTVKGKSRHMLNPEWHWELWLPVLTPTATSRVKHSIWDYDTLGSNDIAGLFYSDFKEVDKKKKVGPRWVNLMGAPTVASSNSEALAVAGGGTNWRAKYSDHPDLGSTYRGRVLISEKVRPELPKREMAKDRPFKAWKRKVKSLDVLKYPQTAKYVLKVGLVSGSELPQLSATMGRGGNRKMGVKITCGKFEIIASRSANNKGCCEWAVSESVSMELPLHDLYPEQFPDVCIYLYTGKTAAELMPMCFTRVKAAELLSEKFSGDFKWHTLQEDKALNKLPEKTFPGCLLLRLGLGTAAVAEETAGEWGRMTSPEALSVKVPYIVRVNIFQCRSLPAADADGMIDPYLKVNVLGAVQATKKKQNTRDPMFYQTFDFKTEINPAFAMQLAPRVCIQLWDSDWGLGSENDDYCGCCMLDLKDAFVDASSAMDEYVLDSKVTEALPDDLPPSITVLQPKTRLEGREFPDPKWVEFMIEKEGDGEGSLLASVQLIPSSPGHAITPPMPSILPDTREAFLEITTLGCRNLIPYNFLPITLPRLEFALELADETIKQSSPDSKKPSPQNPNFLRYDVIPVARFPEKAIFAPRLKIRAFDTRLGGLSKPNIGNCSVALETKLPWDESYVAHESHFSVPPPPVLPIFDTDETKSDDDGEDDDDESGLRGGVGGDEGFGVGELGEEEEEELKEDDVVNTLAATVALEEPVASFKERLTEMAGEEDTGAGVFGALKHLEAELAKEDALLEAAFDIAQDEVDEPDKPPEYMIGRQRLDGTIEEELMTTPFETFQLELGQKGGGLFGGGELRSVGCFKGLIRVLDHEPTKEEAPFDLQSLLKPQSYKVRLYVLRAMALTPMDPGWMGRPGKSDPYLKVELGKDKFNGRDDFVEDATDVDFYQCIELNAELPGAGQMVIKVMDADTFGSDDMIGRTVVDLEDRWFDERWQLLGSDLECKDPEKLRYKVKPLETRELYQPPEGRGAIAQGRIETWVDIMLPAEATAYPADDVALPPEAVFEVRLIVWKAKDVVSMESLTNMNDTYVKAFIEGTDSQSTDIHWRAKKGKASWNYRLKFDVTLGHNTRTMKFPYLNLSMWDKDIIKYDDLIAETVLDLGKYLKRAYKKNKTVKLFEDSKKNRKRSKAKTDAPPKPTEEEAELEKEWEFEEQPEEPQLLGVSENDDTTPAPPSPTNVEDNGAVAAAGENDATPPAQEGSAPQPPSDASLFSGAEPSSTESLFEDSPADGGAPTKEVELTAKGETAQPVVSGASDTVSPMHADSAVGATEAKGPKVGTKKKSDGSEEDKKKKKKGGGCFGKKTVESDDEEAPLLDAEAQEKADDDKEATQAVSMIRGLFGLGEDDPPDSTWLHMTIKDFKNDTRIPMGKLCISISILPKAEAKINDNGFGRREPNHSPLLPPPVGRLKWSWNPFVLGSQLCGPALCFYFTCCLIVSVVIVLMIFCQPAMNLIISVSVKLFL